MENKKLIIEEHVENTDNYSQWDSINFYYDLQTEIGVYKRKISKELEVGKIYDFTFEDYNDCDTYSYLIIKKEYEDVYYMIEYYDEPYKLKEKYLGECWIKCDVLKKLGIDLLQY